MKTRKLTVLTKEKGRRPEMRRTNKMLLLICVATVLAAPMYGALVTPEKATGTSTSETGALYAIDDSGLSTPISETSTHDNGTTGTQWLNETLETPNQYIAFDLGANYDLTEAVLWNHNDTRENFVGRSTQDFNIYTASGMTDDWVQVGSTNTFTTKAEVGGGEIASESFTLTASNVRRVKIETVSSFGPDYLDRDKAGLAEAKFKGGLSATQVTAPSIITPASMTTTSGANNEEGNVADVVNATGLAYDTAHTYLRDAPHSTSGFYTRTNDEGASFTFDLGEDPVAIGGMLVWNYNRVDFTDRGTKNLNVYVSTTGPNGTFTQITPELLTLDEASGYNSLEAQYIDLPDTLANAVRFQDLVGFSDRVGLSEVRFVTGIPEPASAVLLALAGLVMLRRRKVGQTRRG